MKWPMLEGHEVKFVILFTSFSGNFRVAPRILWERQVHSSEIFSLES